MTDHDIQEDKAAMFLEENNISGDAMIECDMSEEGGAMYIHDLLAAFVRSENNTNHPSNHCPHCGAGVTTDIFERKE